MNKLSPLNPPSDHDGQTFAVWSELYGSSGALAIAQFAERKNKLTVVVAGNSKEAETLSESLKFYASSNENLPVLVFPGWECLPYDVFSPHQDILSKRIHLLSILPTMFRGLLVVAADTLMQRVPPKDFIESNSFAFETGYALDVESFRERMIRISYRNVQQVEDPGEYVIRGGVIDVFAMGAKAPVRIELFGDEIDTIRYFEPQTQLSTEKIESFEILPGSEIPMTQDGIRSFRQGIRQHLHSDPRNNVIYNEIDQIKFRIRMELSIICRCFFHKPALFSITSNTHCTSLFLRIVNGTQGSFGAR